MCPEHTVDISIKFCGVTFDNPFVLAAAPPTDELDMVRAAFKLGWAGAVLKTTSVPGTAVNLAYPMMSGLDVGKERLAGLGNIDLSSKYHIDVVEERIKKLKGEFPNRIVIASVSGADRASWEEVTGRAVAAGADIVEASFSCPQGDKGRGAGMMLSQDSKASAEVASWIKGASGTTPVVIKLTPQVVDIAEIAIAVRDAGADAVCVGNTIPALMGVDLDSMVPVPDVNGKSTYSGLSGPAIKPISLRCVAEVSRKAAMPIAASGGASGWEDAMEFVLLGASVVQYCTAVMHRGFGIVDSMIEEVELYLERKGVGSLGEMVGRALPNIVSHGDLDSSKGTYGYRPEIDGEVCIRCGKCMVSCRDGAHGAIELNDDRFPVVDDDKCVGCGLCAVVCPTYCIEMKRT